MAPSIVDPLERIGVPYAIVGSVASSIYGEPRATNDVDVLIQLPRKDAGKLAGAFSAEEFYVPPPEVIEIELSRACGGHINVIALETMMKADFYPLSTWEAAWFTDRRPREIAGRTLWFARPEAVIVHKLRFYREGGSAKHLRDIRSMLAVSGDEIDRTLVERAVAALALAPQWRSRLRVPRPPKVACYGVSVPARGTPANKPDCRGPSRKVRPAFDSK